MNKKFLWNSLALAFIVLIVINVFSIVYIQVLGFDDAFDLEVAKSLSNNFIYQSTYFPRFIYDPRITTNGIIQYLGAANLKLFGDRIGLSITLAILSFFLLIVTSKFSKKAFIALLILIFSYSTVGALMTRFLGEIIALGFLISGIIFNKRLIKQNYASNRIINWLLPAIFYGLAISSKFIIIIVLPFIVFGLFYSSYVNLSGIRLFLKSVWFTFILFLLSVLVFISFFYISVLHSKIAFILSSQHSQLDSLVNSQGLWQFVALHFSQQAGASSGNMFSFNSYSSPLLIPLFFVCAIFLISKSRGWIPLVTLILIVMLKGGLNERRMFLFIIPLILIASSLLFERQTRNRNQSLGTILHYKHFLDILVVSGFVLAFLSTCYFNKKPYLVNTPFEFRKSIFFLENENNANSFVVDNSAVEIMNIIKNIGIPVITSGWWQYPDYQVYSGISFFDRMDLNVGKFLKTEKKLLLLFDPTNPTWPETSREMCTHIFFEKPNVILCMYNEKLPLNLRWDINN